MLILELKFEFFAGKMLNSCVAFSIYELFKNEFVLAEREKAYLKDKNEQELKRPTLVPRI